MKVFIALLLLCIALCHVHHHDSFLTSQSIEETKSVASFEVYDYENHPFKDYTELQIKAMLGLKRHPEYVPKQMVYGINDEALPATFDSRIQWPNCIHPIRDQAQCGSCWAFAASEVLSDRFCISTGGKTDVILSPQDLISCDTSDFGCEGGYLDHSWQYLVNTGIVSEDCLPYSSGAGKASKCPKSGTCLKGVYKKYRAQSFTQFDSINDIKASLIADGPVETGFDVYSDFMSYKSGVYRKTSDNLLGGHAVKVIGWGVENGEEHWIVANSWGLKWGEKGFFRILFGICNIDSDMIAGPINAKDVNFNLN